MRRPRGPDARLADRCQYLLSVSALDLGRARAGAKEAIPVILGWGTTTNRGWPVDSDADAVWPGRSMICTYLDMRRSTRTCAGETLLNRGTTLM